MSNIANRPWFYLVLKNVGLYLVGGIVCPIFWDVFLNTLCHSATPMLLSSHSVTVPRPCYCLHTLSQCHTHAIVFTCYCLLTLSQWHTHAIVFTLCHSATPMLLSPHSVTVPHPCYCLLTLSQCHTHAIVFSLCHSGTPMLLSCHSVTVPHPCYCLLTLSQCHTHAITFSVCDVLAEVWRCTKMSTLGEFSCKKHCLKIMICWQF